MDKDRFNSKGLQEFVSSTEAASILGVHPVAVGQMLRQGRLPGMKVARNWIIPRDALLEFAKTYMKGPGRRKPEAQEGRQR